MALSSSVGIGYQLAEPETVGKAIIKHWQEMLPLGVKESKKEILQHHRGRAPRRREGPNRGVVPGPTEQEQAGT